MDIQKNMFKAVYKFFHKHYHLRYHDKYTHAKKLFVFDLILLASALITFAVSMFFFFWKPGLTDWIDLGMSYGGGRIKSGEKVELTLQYTNRSKETLSDVILAVHLPPGFIINRELTPTTEFSEQSIFSLPNLPPGAQGEKKIFGQLWTEPKNETTVVAILSYKGEKTNRREQKLGSFLVNLPESVVKTTLGLDIESAFPATTHPFTLTLNNTEEFSVENIHLDYTNNSGIVWKDEIEKISLSPKETRTLKGEVTLPKTAGVFALQIKPQVLINNQTINLDTVTKNISIVYPDVSVTASFNTNASYTEPSGIIPIKIFWKNNSQYDLKNLRIKLKAPIGIVNLKETARQNNLKISSNELIMDATNRTLLSDGTPKSSGETDLNLILLPSFSISEQEKAYLEIIPAIEAELKEVAGQTFVNWGQEIKMLLATNATLKAEARYFTVEGDQLGRGPLPPRVNEPTKYWIFAQLQNTTNKLKNISFEAELNTGVTLTGKQSVTIGKPLESRNGKFVWNIFQLPANSITGWYFEVEVTPGAENLGKNLTLIRNINVMATDEETNKNFDLNSGVISNVLPTNDIGRNEGSTVR